MIWPYLEELVVSACIRYSVRTCGQLLSIFVGLGWLAYYLKIVTLQPDDKQLEVVVFIAYFVVTGTKIVDLELDIFD